MAMSPESREALATLTIDDALLERLHAALPEVAADAVAEIVSAVPAYDQALTGSRGRAIRTAVEDALLMFLKLAARKGPHDAGVPLQASTAGAFDLGRAEARAGRSVEAILAAYRVGARVSWRELSAISVVHGVDASTLAGFADGVFAYIDELSAATVSGHAEELAGSARLRAKYLDQLTALLLDGAPAPQLSQAAAKARWDVPPHMCVVALEEHHYAHVASRVDAGTLTASGSTVGLDGHTVVLIVPLHNARDRTRVLTLLRNKTAIVGPTRSWQHAAASMRRVQRAMVAKLHSTGICLDTETRLPELVATADSDALEDLQGRVFAPLTGVTANQRLKLTQTLRAWVAHQGSRDAMAASLHVHAQTIRYRMGQLRELYGDRLDSPRFVQELSVAVSDCSWESAPGVD